MSNKVFLENNISTIYKTKGHDFKILQLTDIHYGNGILSRKKDKMAIAAIRAVIEKAEPDMIVITGDLVYPIPIFSGSANNLKEFKKLTKCIEEYNIPWTCIYGNHDVESFALYNKNKISDFLESLPNCMFQRGPANITGQGNHIIKIRNEDKSLNMALILMDSNMYVKKSFFSGFDHIHDDQIKWYKEQIEKLNKEEGKDVTSMLFFHIPCTEYKTAWREFTDGNKNNNVKYYFGELGETNEYFGTPKFQTKIFEVAKNIGSTKAMFCGHDHYNTTVYEYKGITLVYGMSIDYLAYRKIHKKQSQRGGTLIKIKDDSTFEIEQIKLKDIL